MRPESLELESKSRVAVSQSILQKLKVNSSPSTHENVAGEESIIGGVFRGGQLGWSACASNLEVFSLKTGQRVASQSFDDKSIVTCAAEVTSTDINSCLLMVAVQRSSFGGLLYLFSVQGSRIIHRIDVVDKVTSCCFISEAACKRSGLKAFNGCAAVGTDAGEIFLIDLNLNRCKTIISQQRPYNHNADESSCKILSAPIENDEIRYHVKSTRIEGKNLGIRLDVSVIQQPSAISSILSMPQQQIIVVGFENGLLALFNLHDLNALHLAYPPEIDSPLVRLTFLEPADDPRPCVYIWAFHANTQNFPFAVMHSVSFISKTYQDGENIYETFQWCRPDLTIPIHEKQSVPIACQSVTKIVTEDEDEQYSLCLLGWTNPMSSFVLVFDLNQWYKEQMPRVCDWRDYPSYLAPFPIEIGEKPLDIWLNPKSVVTFNSIQRPEEHFYPTSLSFDLINLTTVAIHKLNWAGLQNNAIKKLSNTGAVAILVPDDCFTEFLEASLIPQLSDQNYHANPSKKMKQEFLLSMALEYNCMSLLRECAQQWADGSHMGRSSSNGLTLSTLTEWIWSQATLIKDRCNDLCVSLFDDSGITIDLRSRKILAHYSRQLKLLADLLHLIIANYRQYIPDEIFDMLTVQRNSIRMTYEYQEVLQWLLNMGLLPEIVWNQLTLPESRNDTFTAIPYPYRILNKFYTEQRQRFYDIDRSNLVPKTNSCKCLYIDSFIERECNSHALRSEWNNGLGDGLYPPPSLQAMLRILLMPGISLENKYMLFVYLFLDLHMVLEGEHFDVVQNLIKFPAVFKLNSSVIKTTQAFWNLDHNEYEIALKELISPLTSDHFIAKWQQELLVNTLLLRDMPNLALQAIRAPGPPINITLRIKTLLANNLVTEAFELQRSKFDEKLLMEFFKGCHELKKWNYVLGLSLTEREGEMLCKFLKTCDSLLSENLQLLYLLQRNKYIDALCYLDDLKHKPRTFIMQQKLENTQDLIISSYKLAMNATDRKLCDQYMSIKNRLQVDVNQHKEPVCPLSSELNPCIVDTNANVVGSVFHRAIVSAKRTGFNCEANKNHIPLLGNIRIEFDSHEIEESKPTLEPKVYAGLLKRRKEVAYENFADPDQKQPAAKRQRTDSFSIADFPAKKHASEIKGYLLSSLVNQSQIAKGSLSERHLDDTTMDTDRDQRNSLGELCETVNLLSTPVVKSSRLEKHSRTESRCQTPQSILKQRHAETRGSIISRRSTSPSLTVHSAKRSVDFNAKPFCYTIPANNDEYRLDSIQESGNMIEDDDDSSSMNSPSSIKGRRPIHSGKNSTASNSMDEFYSPETSKVQEEAEKSSVDIENEDISRISHQVDAKTTTLSPTPRRKLRSNTPEIAIMSSTRITRSRSKLNLEDTVEHEDVSKQPVLNTSTPKRTTPRRSPARSLSKNVITSNALKVQSEAQHEHTAEESGTLKSVSRSQRNNWLKDASAEISMKQHSLAYSDETDATQNLLLQDSSSFASEYSDNVASDKMSENDRSMHEQSVHEQSIDGQSVNDQSMQSQSAHEHSIHDETVHDQVEPETVEDDIEKEIQNQIEEIEDFEEQSQPEDEIKLQGDEQSNDVELTDDIQLGDGNIQEIVETIEVTETITQTVTEHPSIAEARKLQENYLIDSSMGVSESMMQKFNRQEYCTSSFFSETPHAKNLLEDSSIGSMPGAKTSVPGSSSNVGSSEADIVSIDDFESKSDSSSNNTISSDSESSDNELEGDLVYEESEHDDDDVHNDDEVIQISSSSEADNQSENSIDDEDFGTSQQQQQQQQFIDYDELKYDINDELTAPISTTSQPQSSDYEPDVGDYNITELQSAPIQVDIAPSEDADTQNLLTQEQAMNEMIYGDLADAEVLDLDVHNEAFGFEMHSRQKEKQNQDTVYLATVNVASTSNVQNEQLNQDNRSSNEQTHQLDINEENASKQVEPPSDHTVNNDDGKIEMEITSETPIDDTNQAETAADETNVLDNAVLIETTTSKSQESDSMETEYTTGITLVTVNTRPLDATEMEVSEMETESTNIFENAAVASMLEATSSADVEVETATQVSETKSEIKTEKEKSVDEKNEEAVEKVKEIREKSTEKESESKRPRTPARRTRRAASQQEASKEKEVVEKTSDDGKPDSSEVKDTKSKAKLKKADSKQKLSHGDDAEVEASEAKPKSRTTRGSSQQPTSKDTKAEDLDRNKRAPSEQRDFTLLIKRIDDSEAPKEAPTSTQSVDESGRKKRGVSQQKEIPPKSDNEPSTSTATTQRRTRTKSITESGLGNTFDAEESVPSHRLRKATSHQSLSEIEEIPSKRAKSPSRTKSDTTALRRAASQQSLSNISDSGNQASEAVTSRRTTRRTNSVLSLQSEEGESLPRTRRAASQQRLNEIDQEDEVKTKRRRKVKSESTDSESELGDRFDANESSSNRRLRKAVSHQVLTKIVETPNEDSPAKKGSARDKKEASTPTRRGARRAASQQSLSSAADSHKADDEAMDIEVELTLSGQRTKQQTTEKTDETPKTGKTPSKSRARRAPSEAKQSPTTSEGKAPRKTRSNKKDDDSHSEASSIVSTRSRKAAGANTDDDASSVKSSRVRTTRSGSVLPAIVEIDDQSNSSLPQEYLDASRMTRSQRAAIEKYSKPREKPVEATETTSTRRNVRKQKSNVEDEEAGSDHSDTESLKSQRSTVSKASKVSKKSKTSEVSSSQRSTRQRAQKK